MTDVATIRARVAAATPGTWKLDGMHLVAGGARPVATLVAIRPTDAAVLTHAPTDLAYLLDLIDGMEAAMTEARSEAAHWKEAAIGSAEIDKISHSTVLIALLEQFAGEAFISDESMAAARSNLAVEFYRSSDADVPGVIYVTKAAS